MYRCSEATCWCQQSALAASCVANFIECQEAMERHIVNNEKHFFSTKNETNNNINNINMELRNINNKLKLMENKNESNTEKLWKAIEGIKKTIEEFKEKLNRLIFGKKSSKEIELNAKLLGGA